MTTQTIESVRMIRVGQKILDKFKQDIGEEAYNKIINSPIKSCRCGFIKEGNEEMCPKCEKEKSK